MTPILTELFLKVSTLLPDPVMSPAVLSPHLKLHLDELLDPVLRQS